MAKWSGVYLEDCDKFLKKIEKWAEKQVKENDAILKNDDLDEHIEAEARWFLVRELQDKIKKWRKEMFNE